ncbi:MAG: hypothetical protein MJ252_10165 [archaeon]|nr:hypothetical protein [archaeon]
MNDIFNNTYAYNYNWGQSIRDYQNKYALSTMYPQRDPKITHQMMKANDAVFNPILQTYTNQGREAQLRKDEKDKLISTIIKNQDNALKTEQTFNIINLRDKLKGLENHKDYPRENNEFKIRKKLETSKVDYNILSNLPLSEHHFDKPENRPKCGSTDNGNRHRLLNSNQRDYDIISTRYKQFHDEKCTVDHEIRKMQTAKLFYKKNDYNIIKGRFFDDTKEENFQKEREKEQREHGIEYKKNLPRCAKGQSDLYNLINMKPVNNEELTMADKTEKNKKKRYELRYQMESFYHDKNIHQQDKKNEKIENKNSYLRYKESDDRMYDILDLKDRPFRAHAKNVKKDNLTDWEKLVNGAGKNNTFATKTIYKDMYDYSEVGENYDKFRNARNLSLQQLPEISKDDHFGGKVPHKQKVMPKPEEKKLSVRDRMIKFDKELFFRPPKNVYFKEDNVPVLRKNPEMNKKSDTVDMTKEKNTRTKYYTKGMLGMDKV